MNGACCKCAQCGKDATHVCGHCYTMGYCSTECQCRDAPAHLGNFPNADPDDVAMIAALATQPWSRLENGALRNYGFDVWHRVAVRKNDFASPGLMVLAIMGLDHDEIVHRCWEDLQHAYQRRGALEILGIVAFNVCIRRRPAAMHALAGYCTQFLNDYDNARERNIFYGRLRDELEDDLVDHNGNGNVDDTVLVDAFNAFYNARADAELLHAVFMEEGQAVMILRHLAQINDARIPMRLCFVADAAGGALKGEYIKSIIAFVTYKADDVSRVHTIVSFLTRLARYKEPLLGPIFRLDKMTADMIAKRLRALPPAIQQAVDIEHLLSFP